MLSTPNETTVQVDFTLAIGAGRLDASLPVPAGDVTLTQLLPVLQSLSSNIIGSTVGIVHAEGHTISCRAGCGACCRQVVPLSLFEAEYLAAYIRTLPLHEQEILAQRFHTALIALRESGILARMDPAEWIDGSPEATTFAVDYLRQRVPCPFLIDESCSIHPIRPLICREYLVTSPPELCADPTVHPVTVVPMPVKLSTVLFRLGAQVNRSEHGWIPLVFLFAWMQAEAHPGNAIAGPGPELLYEIVKRLTPA